jgi:glutamyl-tRNA synthetase
LAVSSWQLAVKKIFADKGMVIDNDEIFTKVLNLVKDRCTLLPDFYEQAAFFFKTPEQWDVEAVKPKWNEVKKSFFETLSGKLLSVSEWSAGSLETVFKEIAVEKNIKPGELQLPLRIMLVGGKFGPPVFQIAEVIGKNETILRINKALEIF